MATNCDDRSGEDGHGGETSESRSAPTDAEIKRTFLQSTKRQRALWVRLMLAEKRRTNDASLDLSSWIIRQLPQPDDDGESRGDRA